MVIFSSATISLFAARRETPVRLDSRDGLVRRVRRAWLATQDPGEHEERKEEG